MYRLLFLLFATLFSAQNYRFVYEYKMKPDAGKKDSVVTDYMNLDTDGKKSYFYNAVKYERDSAYTADKNNAALFQSKHYDQNLNYIIEKQYAKKTVNFYDKFKSVNLLITDNDAPKWKIEKEFATINTMNCQKATTDYKGRKWEAWFSKEYPISDGPYKFSGLPGVVLKLKDADDNHVFNLIQIKKIQSLFALVPKSNKQVSREEYKKIMKNYTFIAADDIQSMNMDSKAGMMSIQLKDGYIGKFDTNQLKKSGAGMDAEIAKRLRKTNNPIEMD
ncbi:GLPGLI family protein [Chryseobacterium soli]|uniref:GLPGLI family protein n=1 Tax=Chryseobacterium soli TaxID=445961 RepID=UPI00068D9380|nr:GLPGLI family protein [Chryseobacterium soli]